MYKFRYFDDVLYVINLMLRANLWRINSNAKKEYPEVTTFICLLNFTSLRIFIFDLFVLQ